MFKREETEEGEEEEGEVGDSNKTDEEEDDDDDGFEAAAEAAADEAWNNTEPAVAEAGDVTFCDNCTNALDELIECSDGEEEAEIEAEVLNPIGSAAICIPTDCPSPTAA